MQSLSQRRAFQAARPVVVSAPRPVVPVCVKPAKAADFRSLSDDEILNKIGNLKTELASVRFLQRTRGISELKPGEAPQPDPEKTPKAHLNRHIRKTIAKLWTVYRERQVKEGVSSRDSKKIMVKAGLGL